MKYKIIATNTHKNEVTEYYLEDITGEGDFRYFDEALGEYVHPQEVADNLIREVNDNVILANSPIRYLKPGDEADFNQSSMTFDIHIVCEE